MVYFKINFRIKYLFHPITSTFKQLSIQSSFMSRSHRISKVLHISAFFLANITVGESSFMNSLHMNSKVPFTSGILTAYITLGDIFLIIPHLLMKITNNYNFIIMFPIPSLSKPWEDIPLTQSF